jgi:glycosyltransferase involved in cell wall biosynthesis
MIENLQVPKKKIVLVSNSAWSVFNFRLEVIRHLRQRYDVFVIAPADECTEMLVREGCSFLPLSFNNRSANPVSEFYLYSRLKSIYRRLRPDFIFHYVIKPNIYGSLAAGACGIPSVAVITGLGYAFAKHNWLYRTVSFLYRKALRKTTAAWFLNQEDADIFIREKLVDPSKIKILPGEGVNTGYFAPAGYRAVPRNRPFQFLMSARLLKSKGVRVYAEAARILLKKKMDLRFVLIGFFEKHHPDSISELELKIWQRRGLIQYGGFARDVRPFLSQADCFVFPSFYHEGVPRSLLEAASMELPIITSKNRGCTEVVEDDLNGLLVNINDAKDLALKMEVMVGLTAGRRLEMGKKGRERMLDKFDVQKIISVYDQILLDTHIL